MPSFKSSYSNIARFTRAEITGVTLNEYQVIRYIRLSEIVSTFFIYLIFTSIIIHFNIFIQVIRGNELNKAAGLTGKATSVQCDFMKLDKFADESFDGVYAIEATCHAPVREGVYGQIFRVLKPGW